MILKGNSDRYGPLAAALHWVSALAILAMLALGFIAARSPDPALTATLLRIHIPLGVLVLALTVTRIVWWLFDRRPAEPAGQPRWQSIAAHTTHGVMYGVLILMGASGIGLTALSGAGAVLFLAAPGPLPDFTSFAPMKAHALGAFAMVGLLCFHVGAVVYHQFYRRDRPLARMGIGTAESAIAPAPAQSVQASRR